MTQLMTKIASMLLLAGLAVGSAHAQMGGMKVSVPFKFVLMGKTFSAGQYILVPAGEKVQIQNSHGLSVAIVTTDRLSGKVPDRDGRVIFNCYAEQCFLSQVWVPGQDAGRMVPKSKFEIELTRTQKQQQFAFLGNDTTR